MHTYVKPKRSPHAYLSLRMVFTIVDPVLCDFLFQCFVLSKICNDATMTASTRPEATIPYLIIQFSQWRDSIAERKRVRYTVEHQNHSEPINRTYSAKEALIFDIGPQIRTRKHTLPGKLHWSFFVWSGFCYSNNTRRANWIHPFACSSVLCCSFRFVNSVLFLFYRLLDKKSCHA